ncbi:MAG TPA: 3'-5' exonuclease [Gemmatimonadales bacterium]|nr:3'-5' exonuclease [Gemmatimonadales bacterium]
MPAGTLAGRVIARLALSPCDSLVLAREVLGLAAASPAVADRVAVALLGADPRVRRLADGRWCVSGWTSANGGPSANALTQASFAVVDVETTGTSPRRGDRVIEIAVVGLDSTGLRLLYHSLLNPGVPIPRWVGTLTGITSEMLHDRPRFDEIADELVAALAGRVFVAHNARFDWAFVSSELRSARGMRLDGPRLCTVRLARRLVPGLKSRGLDSLARHFGIEIRQRHRAEGDAGATAEVLQRLIGLALEQGLTTIAELEALGRGSSPSRRRRRSALPQPVTEI